jgi:hypothetical protein
MPETRLVQVNMGSQRVDFAALKGSVGIEQVLDGGLVWLLFHVSSTK